MNSDILLGWCFGFIVFTTLIITIHEIVQFKLQSGKKKTDDPLLHPTNGKYFKRFVPLKLKNEFKERFESYNSQYAVKRSRINHIASAFIVVIYISSLGIFLDKNFHTLYKPVDLTQDEKRELKLYSGAWVESKSSHHPVERQVSSASKNHRVVFIKTPDDILNTYSGLLPISNEHLGHWRQWANEHQWKTKVCIWSNLERCGLKNKSDLIVVLPSFWQTKKIDKLLSQGFSVSLSGFPFQLAKNKSEFSYKNINFKKFRKEKKKGRSFRVVGDQRLTLGLLAGQRVYTELPLNRFNYTVSSDKAEALSSSGEGFVSGRKEARLVSLTEGSGRLLWTNILFDQSPTTKNSNDYAHVSQIYNNISKFMTRQSYSAVAHWPEGKPFAAFLEQDSEFQYKNSKKVVQLFKTHNFPVTWFIVSELAEQNRRLTREMASIGEVACHGDNHDVFPAGSLYKQVYRIAKCSKTLLDLADQAPLGFRPPEEKYNTETFDAVANNGFSYIFTEYHGNTATPRIIQRKNKSLVAFGRVNYDDYHLWAIKKFGTEKSKAFIHEDVDWVSSLGGLYTFSFHSQYMNSSGRLSVIEDLVLNLKAREVYSATVSDMAHWWNLRHQLLSGQTATPEQLKKYQPRKVVVLENGQLVKEKY